MESCSRVATFITSSLPSLLLPLPRVHSPLGVSPFSSPSSLYEKLLCLFILSILSSHHSSAQDKLLACNVLEVCKTLLEERNVMARMRSCLLLASVWKGNDQVKLEAMQQKFPESLVKLFHDSSPEVRGAAVYAASTFFGVGERGEEGERKRRGLER